MGIRGLFILIVLFSSCSPSDRNDSESQLFELRAMISLMEYDLQILENEIIHLAELTTDLYSNKEQGLLTADRNKYTLVSGVANSVPNDDPEKSTLILSTLGDDMEEVMEMIYLTNPLDDVFKEIVEKHEIVSQVYFNSSIQLNRLYPPYDAESMLEPDVDLTAFNFYYEANETHNPKRGPVWVKDIYIDPVGRGWIVSLIHPVYFQDELKMVLGIDITLNDLLDYYLSKSSRQLVIIDESGNVVAGKSKGIEALSLPPLKNHTYIQTITSDSFRMEDYNLFKSKNKEVRKMASSVILANDSEFILDDGIEVKTIYSQKMNLLNWYLLDVGI